MNSQELTEATEAAAARCLEEKGYVSMVDLLLQMGLLSKSNYERWRFRQAPYLERMTVGNLSKLTAIARALRAFARNSGLRPSQTVYTSWGKGKRHRLRFSKFGDLKVEKEYSTHYMKPSLKVGGPGASSTADPSVAAPET